MSNTIRVHKSSVSPQIVDAANSASGMTTITFPTSREWEVTTAAEFGMNAILFGYDTTGKLISQEFYNLTEIHNRHEDGFHDDAIAFESDLLSTGISSSARRLLNVTEARYVRLTRATKMHGDIR